MCSTPITPDSRDLGLTAKDDSCACSADGHGTHGATDTGRAENQRSSSATETQYLVTGMTCNHCVASVTEELSELDGVDSVSVELNVGGQSRVTVTTSHPVAQEAIHAAVTEAGYDLASA